ncbi:Hypp5730 [Branchiostoma lanceolatum]|uniref:Hypp5730 protein n=1 Tax=Branchiostoma lanceolatum TaxID=7740 RepID=A0A8J9VJV6_BRALA|nr:Hypp5730 [Branchiostoma lanceolatum]
MLNAAAVQILTLMITVATHQQGHPPPAAAVVVAAAAANNNPPPNNKNNNQPHPNNKNNNQPPPNNNNQPPPNNSNQPPPNNKNNNQPPPNNSNQPPPNNKNNNQPPPNNKNNQPPPNNKNNNQPPPNNNNQSPPYNNNHQPPPNVPVNIPPLNAQAQPFHPAQPLVHIPAQTALPANPAQPLQANQPCSPPKAFLKEVRRQGTNDIDNFAHKKVGRPLKLGDIDPVVQEFVRSTRKAGGPINRPGVMSGAKGIVLRRDRSLLTEYGGHIEITKAWANSLLVRMNFVRRKATKAARKLPADFETTREAFLARIKKAVGDSDIPDDMVINWDQTGINIVPVGDWTLVEAGARQVPVVGHEDKRQITLLLAISLSGHLVPPQVLYQGKTDACHARFNFPDEWDVFHTSPTAQRERLGLANDHPGLAVFDVYKAHRTPGLLEKLKAANVLQVSSRFLVLSVPRPVSSPSMSTFSSRLEFEETKRCPATVTERPSTNVPPTSTTTRNCTTNVKIRAEVREKALGDIFKLAHTIVQETMLENFDETAPNPGLPSISNLMRMANRGREALRPKDHTSIDFELNHDYIPEGFLRADVWVRGARHLVFANDDQLALLVKARNWCCDWTFFVVRPPFSQLFGIHCFIKQDADYKQVPLVFVLMSRREKQDYKEVFQKIRDILPRHPHVEHFIMDFEDGMWGGVRGAFPNCTRKGCAFHLTNAIYRKIQRLGLQPAYYKKACAYDFMRKLMVLHFLPTEHIFEELQAQTDNPLLVELCNYMEAEWLSNSVWTIDEWSVYFQPIRTNNDSEGYHARLNRKAQNSLPFYLLVDLLSKEAQYVKLQATLVSMNRLTRYKRKPYRVLESRLFQLWDEYHNGERTTSSFLRVVSRPYGPVHN